MLATFWRNTNENDHQRLCCSLPEALAASALKRCQYLCSWHFRATSKPPEAHQKCLKMILRRPCRSPDAAGQLKYEAWVFKSMNLANFSGITNNEHEGHRFGIIEAFLDAE